MTRLIDGDKLGKEIFCHSYGVSILENENKVLGEVLQMVHNAPTIEERPHGEWERWGSPFSDDTIANSIVCSICKARYVEIDGEVFNFCPNCGARMKGGDEK